MYGKKVIHTLSAAIACMGLLFPMALNAQDIEKNILTGGATGTYIQFGNDISEIANKCGVALNVQESAGSLENFLGVRKRLFTQFGIVQSDVLEYFRTFALDDPAIRRAIRGVRIAFPLYNEEVHILAKKEIADLSDLNGKRVAVGVQDSGTFLTSSLVLDISGVKPAQRVEIDAEQSLASLLSGDIDAFFYVAGAPTRLFQSPEIDGEKFHLLPITDTSLKSVYTDTKIAANTYPFQSAPVDLVAVKAVLMTYEYNRRKNEYHRASCKAVSDISNLILTNFKSLQEDGHPKWKDVSLGDIPPGWDIGGCVNTGLAANYALECNTPEPAASSIENEVNSAYRSRICASLGC